MVNLVLQTTQCRVHVVLHTLDKIVKLADDAIGVRAIAMAIPIPSTSPSPSG